MSLFRKDLGAVSVDFFSENEAMIRDSIPQPSRKLPATIAFPFLAASKLLYNFPPPSGQLVLREIHDRMHEAMKGKVTAEEKDIPFLGLLSKVQLLAQPAETKSRWTYTFTLFEQKGGYGINLNLADGNEETLHRACMDLIWQHFKLRWGLGTILVAFAQQFFTQLMVVGVENLPESYGLALETARQMSGFATAIFE